MAGGGHGDPPASAIVEMGPVQVNDANVVESSCEGTENWEPGTGSLLGFLLWRLEAITNAAQGFQIARMARIAFYFFSQPAHVDVD